LKAHSASIARRVLPQCKQQVLNPMEIDAPRTLLATLVVRFAIQFQQSGIQMRFSNA
jgi:hypothetical protein